MQMTETPMGARLRAHGALVKPDRPPRRDEVTEARGGDARVGAMKAAIWGCRGTLPAPGSTTVRYGGNTTCVAVETAEGRHVVLDCGSGIRRLGRALAADAPAE